MINATSTTQSSARLTPELAYYSWNRSKTTASEIGNNVLASSYVVPSTTSATYPAERRMQAMSQTLERLSELFASDEFESDFLQPNEAVRLAVHRLVTAAAAAMSKPLPIGNPSTIGDGGVTLEFDAGDQFVMLIMPPWVTGARLVSRIQGDESVCAATPENLAQLLEKLG